MRKFELNEKVSRFTEPKECVKVCCVIQDTKKVIDIVTGLESMIFMYL